MCFVGQGGLLALIRLPLGLGGSGHPHLSGILPDCHWVGWIWSPSLVGNTPGLPLALGGSGHLTCRGYYRIATGVRWIWSPSFVGDTTRLPLGSGGSGHPHLSGILPDCHRG